MLQRTFGGVLGLESETRRVGSVAVVSFRGKITLGDACATLRQAVDLLLNESCPQIVFNLADVPFIDSAGLGVLTMSFTKSKNAGGLLKLAQPQGRVRDALEMTRLIRIFPLYATEAEAIQSFNSSKTPENVPQAP